MPTEGVRAVENLGGAYIASRSCENVWIFCIRLGRIGNRSHCGLSLDREALFMTLKQLFEDSGDQAIGPEYVGGSKNSTFKAFYVMDLGFELDEGTGTTDSRFQRLLPALLFFDQLV